MRILNLVACLIGLAMPVFADEPFTVDGSTIYVKSGRVGVATATPQTRLDVEGDAQFGSGATKSTFTATGLLRLTASGIQWADGTTSTTALAGSGGAACSVVQSTTTENIPAASGSNTDWTGGAIAGSSVSLTGVAAASYIEFQWLGRADIDTGGLDISVTVMLNGARQVRWNASDPTQGLWNSYVDSANPTRDYGIWRTRTAPGAGNYTAAIMVRTTGGIWRFRGNAAYHGNSFTMREVSCSW